VKLRTLNNGKIISGNNAVTYIGTISVIHHIAIHTVDANTIIDSKDSPCICWIGNNTMSKKISGPKNNPMVDARLFDFIFSQPTVIYHKEAVHDT
jgi:hypothetical protein